MIARRDLPEDLRDTPRGLLFSVLGVDPTERAGTSADLAGAMALLVETVNRERASRDVA